MAGPIAGSVKTTFYRADEIQYGTLINGAITNGDYDITLAPGYWVITLFVNANLVSAGTITCSPMLSNDTVAAEETVVMLSAGLVATVVAASLIDYVGLIVVAFNNGSSGVTHSGFSPLAVWNKVRFTIAAIAGASATNRIDYVAKRV